jgi:hypothetical protein
MKIINNLDFSNYQALNVVLQNLASDPGSPSTGQIWFNTSAGADSQGRAKVKLGTRTIVLDDQYVTSVTPGTALTNSGTALAPTLNVQASSGSVPGTMSAADYTTLHAATNLASGSTLVLRDSSGNAQFNTISIANAPVNQTDGVNLAYVQSIAAGFYPKSDVVCATTGPLPTNTYASGPMTLTASANGAFPSADGITLGTIGQRILVKNEATAANNGIYTLTTVGTGGTPWVLTRSDDFDNTTPDTPGLIQNGAYLFVAQGSTLQATQWIVTTVGTINLGSTGITFAQSGASASYTGTNGVTVSGSSIYVNLTGTTTLEAVSNALRVKSNANTGQPLLSNGTGNEAAYGAIALGGGSNIVTGTLPIGNGGTGLTSTSQSFGFLGPVNGSGAPTWRLLVASDLPTVGSANTYTKVTTDAYGRVSSGTTLSAGDIPNLNFSQITAGVVPLNQGGTGVNVAALNQAPLVEKVPVVAVAVANINIASPGATIDGVGLSASQRILLTGQTAASQNGLWVWNSSGSALTRPLDFPSGSTVHGFYGVEIEVLAGGTSYAGSVWYISTTGVITIDTTSISIAQIPYNVNSGGISGTLPVVNGGTGSGSASGARTNLGATGKYATTIGDGVTTTYTITHNLGTTDVVAAVTLISGGVALLADWAAATSNTITVTFGVAPASNTVRVVVVG